MNLAGGSGSSASGGSITIASGCILVAHRSVQGLSLCQVLMQDRVELAETSLRAWAWQMQVTVAMSAW